MELEINLKSNAQNYKIWRKKSLILLRERVLNYIKKQLINNKIAINSHSHKYFQSLIYITNKKNTYIALFIFFYKTLRIIINAPWFIRNSYTKVSPFLH